MRESTRRPAGGEARRCAGCGKVVCWLVPDRDHPGTLVQVLHPRAGGKSDGPGHRYWCQACRAAFRPRPCDRENL